MNQDQRKYLIAQVNSTCRSQIEKLEKSKPKRPSLNNYIIASFLDDTVKFNNITKLKEKIKERVLAFGHTDTLLESGNDRWRDDDEDDSTKFVKLKAEDLFILPSAYKESLKVYLKKAKEIDDKIEELRATEKTIEMKIQIGSSSSMDKLVMQIDNMGDLNIINTQLLIGKGEE